MNVIEAQRTAERLIAEHGLSANGWRFRFDTAVKRFGCCTHHRKLISLSRKLTEINDVEQVTDTILHEIAHALVGGGHGHDSVWKAKCREIGCRPVRCYSSTTVTSVQLRYVTQCCAANTTSKAKRPTGRYTCRKCLQRVTWLDTKTGERFEGGPIRSTARRSLGISFEFHDTAATRRAFAEAALRDQARRNLTEFDKAFPGFAAAAQNPAPARRPSGAPCRKPRGLGGQGI